MKTEIIALLAKLAKTQERAATLAYSDDEEICERYEQVLKNLEQATEALEEALAELNN